MLKVNNLNAGYGDLQVLYNVSFDIGNNEIVTLLGPNGAGKTTTLKTISGMIRPMSGSINFLGNEISGLPPHKIIDFGISFVTHDRGLFPEMSVKENLELGAYTRRSREKMKEMLEFVYELFPILKERSKQLASTLSGGEQQMLAIGKALMSSPELLMMDEPSFGLAPRVILKLFEAIKQVRGWGIAVLLVEQNVWHALEISDRAYVLSNGKIVLSGKSKDLREDEYIKTTYLGSE
jgi:branched-chain amino acid transport system ATP-binding protein